MISGNQLCYDLEDFYQEYVEKANKRRYLYQYTNFDSFLHIAMEHTLLFNRIDKMNDRQEAELFKNEEVARLVFISCFSTQQEESIPMWNTYTQKNEGIRLKIEITKEKVFDSIFDDSKNIVDLSGKTIGQIGRANGSYDINDWLADISQSDIWYKDSKEIDEFSIKEGNVYCLNRMAVVKDKAWNYERESRFILKLRTVRDNVEIPNITGFLVPINFENIKTLEITFGPWMDDCKKNCIKDVVEKYLPRINVKFKDSKFIKKIARK